MKKTVLILSLAIIALVGCKDDNNGLLDPNAMVSLRPDASMTRAEVAEGHLSALEIVKLATGIKFINEEIYGDEAVGIGLGDVNRDIPNVRLLMWGTDIIDQSGYYVPTFIESTDLVLRRTHMNDDGSRGKIDTIGYIKNETLRSAAISIKAAYDKGDYKSCYEQFDVAFTFLPVTSAEWRALKAENKN